MNINPTFFIIMVELLAVESLILIVISALYIRRKYQCKAVLQNIIHATESSGNARQQVLENTLKDMFKDGEENASEIAAKLVKAEGRFHKRLITTFIEQDHGSLSGLFKWTDKLLSPYRTMISDTATELDTVKKQSRKKVEKLEQTVETLSKEKTELTKELDHTKQELDSIMSEYVSAFDKEKQRQEKAATEQKYTVEKQDAGVYRSADKGITVETGEVSAEKGSGEETAQSEPARDTPQETQASPAAVEEEQFEISVEEDSVEAPEKEGDDEGMLKIEDLEDPAPPPENEPAAAPESGAQAGDAILDDVDIDSLIDGNGAAAGKDARPGEEKPPQVAVGQS